jgi:MFS family permease
MVDEAPAPPQLARTEPQTAPQPRRFLLLFLCLLIIGAGNSMLLAIAPPLVRSLNLSDSSIGWIFSLSALIWVIVSPFWGRASDRVGRRKPFIALGLGAYAVSMSLFAAITLIGMAGVVTGFALFISLTLARSLFGAFGSATSPSAQAYVADHTPRSERTEQLASLTSAFALGGAFGPALCAAIAAKFGLVTPIFMVAVFAISAAFAVLRFLPEDAPAKAPQPKSAGGWSDALTLLFDKRVSAYLLYGCGLSLISGTLVQTFGLFTMDRLDADGTAGAELIAAGFMVSALALIATQLAVLPRLKLEPRALMIWGTALFALGIVIQIIAPSLGALLLSQAVQGVGFGLARPGFTGGASVAVRHEEQGGVAGLVVACNGAGFVISPITGAVAYELWGMNTPLYIALVTALLMLVFSLQSRRLRSAVTAAPNETPPA